MSLFDEIVGENVRPGPVCGIARIRGQLGPTEQGELDRALADPNLTATAIARVLRKRHFIIGDDSVRRHRKPDCACVAR